VKSLDPKKIKSAQRALEVLEYFTDERPTATVMDIARSMNYPQSSTSELLGCLVALGYLDRDRDARTYRPTARVAVIGSSVQPDLFRKGRLLAILDHLAEEAGVAVTLAHKVGMSMQYIHLVRPAGHATPAGVGTATGLASSSAGKALLATFDPNLVRKLVHRINAEAHESAPRICATELADELRAASIQGYAMAVEDDLASLSMLVSLSRDAAPLVLTIHGDAAFFAENRDWLLQMTRGSIARLTNPTAPRPLAEPLNLDAEPQRRFA
jgi:DNA-binding IclR family transcriptional regulator